MAEILQNTHEILVGLLGGNGKNKKKFRSFITLKRHLLISSVIY